jgi:prepilin-type N-terminal cleavage/methylation domain-containing protein
MIRAPRGASPGRARPGPRADDRGFTLIEMVAVMVVIGLIFTLVLPQFRARTHADLKRSAMKLAATIEHVFYQSVFRHETLRLHYDLAQSRYWLDRFVEPAAGQADAGAEGEEPDDRTDAADGGSDGEPSYVVDTSIIPQPVDLPRGVVIASVSTQYIEETTEGDAYTHFFPDGYVEPTVIHMTDKEGSEYTLFASPISGRVKVLPGHHEFDVEMKEERR